MNTLKKILSIFLVTATLLCFASCKNEVTSEDMDKIAEKSDEEMSESVSKHNKEVSKAADDAEDGLGKTRKNKQIVAKIVYLDHVQYDKIVFDENGLAEYKEVYKYYDTDEHYNQVLSYGDNSADGKLIDNDPETRMIACKSTSIAAIDYDTFYELYERKSPDICTIIK